MRWICGEGYVDEFDVKGEVDRLAAALGTQPEITGSFWAVQLLWIANCRLFRASPGRLQSVAATRLDRTAYLELDGQP
jgi:hypothetical protein